MARPDWWTGRGRGNAGQHRRKVVLGRRSGAGVRVGAAAVRGSGRDDPRRAGRSLGMSGSPTWAEIRMQEEQERQLREERRRRAEEERRRREEAERRAREALRVRIVNEIE